MSIFVYSGRGTTDFQQQLNPEAVQQGRNALHEMRERASEEGTEEGPYNFQVDLFVLSNCKYNNKVGG